MKPGRGIVRTYIWSEDIYTRLDSHITPTIQSSDTDDAPRDPLLTLLYLPLLRLALLEFWLSSLRVFSNVRYCIIILGVLPLSLLPLASCI